ncbi:Major Facilitator superfamily [Seminavis robusta]|uniref:Major Facilitator superfamily n=1 Tax=Seminavis robusta TaxID=568900 RepID=A0A9N8HEB4_9STRA|nr:Major Facilitator superfamily [Seminavis robusta]|eukprot:Sro507_g156550.1 Major Facilitator superfamily (527) ;mRNA; f:38622-40202
MMTKKSEPTEMCNLSSSEANGQEASPQQAAGYGLIHIHTNNNDEVIAPPKSVDDIEMTLHHEPNDSKDDASYGEENDAAAIMDNRPLTKLEIWNLVFCVLAWACTIANVTLVVGTSNVVLLSIGGDPSLSSVPLATFFMGASLVSLLVTPWHFVRLGRKLGFLAGVCLGLLGSGLGCWAVWISSTALLIVATACFGAAMGIGFYLRFAAVEVVPFHWADKAVTLVVSGGCIAAFAGPESAEGTRGKFGDEEHLLYLGVFIMTAIFNVANGIFTASVQFPDTSSSPAKKQTSHINNSPPHWPQRVWAILQSRNFIVPMLISAGSWIIMALPMSVLRVAMHQVGFSSRQSLLTIELHFFGMYAPGFFTGRWIASYGPRVVAVGSVAVFLAALACLQTTNEYNDDSSNIALWIVGMVLIGVGWNCAFSGSTVGSTRAYNSRPDCKSAIQAANDGLTFLLAGAVICSASSIYQAGGEGMEGWRVVNWVVVGFIGVFSLILFLDVVMDRFSLSGAGVQVDVWSLPSSKIPK